MEASNPWIKEQSEWSDAVSQALDTAERLKIGRQVGDTRKEILSHHQMLNSYEETLEKYDRICDERVHRYERDLLQSYPNVLEKNSVEAARDLLCRLAAQLDGLVERQTALSKRLQSAEVGPHLPLNAVYHATVVAAFQEAADFVTNFPQTQRALEVLPTLLPQLERTLSNLARLKEATDAMQSNAIDIETAREILKDLTDLQSAL